LRHVVAFLIKMFVISAVLFITMSMMNQYAIGPTIMLALLVTILAYLVGDLGVLPMSTNMVATLSDIALATLTIWIIGPFIVNAAIPFLLALFSGVIIGAGEWFFHKYFVHTVMPRKDAK
jgi:hypothetical protein